MGIGHELRGSAREARDVPRPFGGRALQEMRNALLHPVGRHARDCRGAPRHPRRTSRLLLRACAGLAFISGFRVWSLGVRVSSLGGQGSSLGFRVSSFGFRVSSFGFQVSGSGFRVSRFEGMHHDGGCRFTLLSGVPTVQLECSAFQRQERVEGASGIDVDSGSTNSRIKIKSTVFRPLIYLDRPTVNQMAWKPSTWS